MSAVAEREAASLAELQAAIEKRQAERQQLLTKLAELVQTEEAERSALLRAKPDADPFAVGTRAKRLHDERAKIERAISNLEQTIVVLEGHATAAGAERAVDEVRGYTERAQKLSKADDALVRKAGKILAEELLPVWNQLSESYEAREALRGEVERAGLLPSARFLDPEAVSAFEQVIDFPGPRIPVDIGGLLEMLLEIAFDPSNHGYREVENGGDRRYGSHLPKLVPDLKGQDRRAELSARTAGRVGIFGGSNQPGSSFTVS
jgi:hypothetical protein